MFIGRIVFLLIVVFCSLHVEHAFPDQEQGSAVLCARGECQFRLLSAVCHDVVSAQEKGHIERLNPVSIVLLYTPSCIEFCSNKY